ncbi:metalloendoproteinase 1-MMP-like [Nymphaea colorata]|uniref:Peptidase metallopeptidase domain-containing protein n=1 Tax=Nymphaea colorata TaxID=210225 RepID=A0A5K0YQC2_9MAGN|nr:metalloendoproteinase 1-MMP-like [Nymphaea colorata]VVV78853.1 unnamed protein product [Nymphaea colorata]
MLFFFFPISPLLLSLPSSSFFLFLLLPLCSPATDTSGHLSYTWKDLWRFADATPGSHVIGMSEIKRYLHQFGYFPAGSIGFSDHYDANLQASLRLYQTRLGLPVTGTLNRPTLSQMITPRCGVHDGQDFSGVARRYVYFPGRPTWQPGRKQLSYWIYTDTFPEYLEAAVIRQVFERAFAKWAAAIPMNFTATDLEEAADIRIGFYSGEHGDREPFDGVLGVLGHAFAPENGRLHLDSAETWAVDLEADGSKVAVHLESVVVHEIGHLLGLGHSSVKEAVMYPSLRPRTRKTDLSVDDVKGVQSLYGSNPNFVPSSVQTNDQHGQQVGSGAYTLNGLEPWCFLFLLFSIFF